MTRSLRLTGFALLAILASTTAPIFADPQNFVFFNVERERIREKSFLETDALVGAQLKYKWSELEPERGEYRIELILKDLEFLERHGKKLWIQIQDVSFSEEIVNVPDYIREDPVYGGGVHLAYEEREEGDETPPSPAGWVPRRWDPEYRERFLELLRVLATKLDGKIEGLNLPETSIGFGGERYNPEDFSDEIYLKSVLEIMTGARSTFEKSHVVQYANFMHGEWLPWENRGYLERVYAHASEIGMGVGGPDLLPFRRGQNGHSYPLIAARGPEVIAGVAVQWGNFEDINPATGKRSTVEELYEFGRDTLRLDYIFWGTQEPYYSEEVIPYVGQMENTSER